MKPALNRGLRKLGRDLLQVIAAGGATAVVALITGHLHPEVAVIVAFAFKLLMVFAQNTLETNGSIPVILPSPGLVTTTTGGLVGKAVGTVDTVVQGAGATVAGVGATAAAATQVVGAVVDTAGQVVGNVTGAVGGLLGDVENLGGL
jgi:hypothetical protein